MVTQYTITLNPNGGQLLVTSTYKLRNGDKYGTNLATRIPVREGYEFKGWGLNQSTGDVLATNSTFNKASDTILYAKWNLISYSVTYELLGGTQIAGNNYPASFNVESNVKVGSLTKQHHTFSGWLDVETREFHEEIILGTSIGNKTYRAVFKPNIYRIAFNLNASDEVIGVMPEQVINYGVNTPTLKNRFIRGPKRELIDEVESSLGRGLLQWNNSPNSNGITNTEGALGAWDKGNNLDLYESINHKPSFEDHNSARYGHVGWNTQADGSGIAYADQATLRDLTSVDSQIITFYAIWGGQPTKLSLLNHDGSLFKEFTHNRDAKVYFDSVSMTPFKRAYIFDYWAFTDGTEVSWPITITDPTILEPRWIPVTYNITYTNLLNGSNHSSNPHTFIIEDIGGFGSEGSVNININNPTNRPGYTGHFNPNIINTIGHKTLEAVWVPNPYIVKYYKNSEEATGTMANTDTEYQKTFKLRKNEFARRQYRFLGWATEPNGPVKFTDTQSVLNLAGVNRIGDVVDLYAKWESSKLRISGKEPVLKLTLDESGDVTTYEIKKVYVGDEVIWDKNQNN